LLVDSIGKKIKVVEGVTEGLGLTNVQAQHIRAEDVDQDFEFIVSRAVTRLSPFYNWVRNKISPNHFQSKKNGLILLKGGDLKEEIEELERKTKVVKLPSYFEEPFFETKKLVYVPM
jgi:16S rRNA (guanine527-N7)-methyltransferase